MNRSFLILSTMALLSGSHSLYAITADPAVRSYKQPNGTVVQYHLSGDEFRHETIDLNGRQLCYDATSRAFRVMTAAEIQARSEAQAVDASAAAETHSLSSPHLIPAPGTERRGFYPTTGSRHSLVFLIEFDDVQFTTVGDDPQAYYTRMLNEEGFSDFGATGSARDYYLTASMGLFDPTFDVVGPIRLDKSRDYYGSNGTKGSDIRQAEPIYEACIIADSLGLVDFTQYDDDNNGVVDNIFYFYAGFGEADTGFSNTIWPHSWNLDNAELPLTLQGKKIYSYACSNEIRYQEGVTEYEPTGIGTFVHEFAHVLGLPDLYNTNGGLTSMLTHTPDVWSVMDKGPYNNDTRTPPTFSSYERYSVGWLTPEVIDAQADTTVVLPDLLSSNVAYAIEVPGRAHECFLLENRQQNDWDTYLPNHGMLVWHIDYDSLVWAANSPNNEARQRVDIYEADGDNSSSTYKGDVLPGIHGITSLTLEAWDGSHAFSPCYVREEEGVIRFLVDGVQHTAATPQHLQIVAHDAWSLQLKWDAVADASGYEVKVFEGDSLIRQQQVSEPTVLIDQLQPLTSYHLSVVAMVAEAVSEPAVLSAMTDILPFAQRIPSVEAATAVTDSSFVAHWQPLTDATDYLLTLCKLQSYVSDGAQGYDFTDKADGMPMLWQSSSSTYYAINGYYGAASPSLRFSKDNDYLYIAYPEATITSLSFWMRGQKAQGSVDVECQQMTEGDWTLVRNIPLTAEGQTISLQLEQPVVALRIVYHRDGGFVAIDDVMVNLIAQQHAPLPGYADLSVGDVTELTLCPLLPSTTYTYRICAVNASGERSLYSEEMYVVTAEHTEPSIDPEDPEQPVDTVAQTTPTHKILFEEFTGQNCIYCPQGAENVAAAIAGYEDRVVEVKHHAGYYPDYLTCEADLQYAELFGVTSAPTGIVNRAEFGQTLSLTFTATTYTDSIRATVERELAKPDYVTVNIETAYDEETRTITARVFGHLLQPLPADHPRLNVWVTESGYKGSQNTPTGVNSAYIHTNYQRQCLTELKGDVLSLDADGRYDQTFTYVIPASYPAYTTSGPSSTKKTEAKPQTTRIVAFVSNWNRADDCEVFNANSVLIGRNAEDNAEAIEEIAADAAVSDVCFDLMGRRQAPAATGLFIRGRKLILIR